MALACIPAGIAVFHTLRKCKKVAGVGLTLLDYLDRHFRVVSECKEYVEYCAPGFCNNKAVYRVAEVGWKGAAKIKRSGSKFKVHLDRIDQCEGWQNPFNGKQNLSVNNVAKLNDWFDKFLSSTTCLWIGHASGCAEVSFACAYCVGKLLNHISDKSNTVSPDELNKLITDTTVVGGIAGTAAGISAMVAASQATTTVAVDGMLGYVGFTTTAPMFTTGGVAGVGLLAAAPVAMLSASAYWLYNDMQSSRSVIEVRGDVNQSSRGRSEPPSDHRRSGNEATGDVNQSRRGRSEPPSDEWQLV